MAERLRTSTIRSFRVIIPALLCPCLFSCKAIQGWLVELYTPEYRVEQPGALEPLFLGKDAARPRIAVHLKEVAKGFPKLTDIQFLPGAPPFTMLVAQQEGDLKVLTLTEEGVVQSTRLLKHFPVLTRSEEGLLGIAVHPRFPSDPRIFLNLVTEVSGEDRSQILELTFEGGELSPTRIARTRLIMEVVQPYPNHNAGQLAFGPDGYLYIGWGDGGWRGDPHENSQNPRTFLGKMLRVDVNAIPPGKPYAIPPDNPFGNDPRFLPEIFALGLRNPWRYSFDPRGRLIVADVGQDAWEEINIVEAGKNYGWNRMEGFHCYAPKKDCSTEGLALPIYEYGHEEGQSLTGGYVYTGKRLPSLKDLYVFGDFVQGKIWAIPLPDSPQQRVELVYALGKWPILISTFGRDPSGELYVGDYAQGVIYKIVP